MDEFKIILLHPSINDCHLDTSSKMEKKPKVTPIYQSHTIYSMFNLMQFEDLFCSITNFTQRIITLDFNTVFLLIG